MEDETRARSLPGLVIPIGPIILIVIVVLILRSRRQSTDEHEFSRITSTIDDSALPGRAKELLLQRVDEVRGAMTTIREMAGEMRKD